MITVSISGRKANKTDIELITSGSVGKKIKFVFDAEWDGLSRLACFTGSSSRDQVLDSNNECVIPWECMQNPGKPLIVGIYGTNSAESVVIPTIYCNIGMIHKGATPCNETAQQATPTAVQQMMTAADRANTVYTAYQAGELKGETGPRGPIGMTGATGDSGVYIGSSEPTDGANVWIDTTGSGEAEWEQVGSFILGATTNWSKFKTDGPNIALYNFKKVMVMREYPQGCDLTGVSGYGRIRFYNSSGNYLTTESARPTANDKPYANLSIFDFDRNMATVIYTRTTTKSNGAVPLNIKHYTDVGFALGFGNCVKVETPAEDKDPAGTSVTIYAIRG